MDPHANLRVVVVEDEGFFRAMLCSALSGVDTIEVVGAFADSATALAEIPTLEPDVALLDIDLGPGDNGIRLAAALKRERPALTIVFLSNHDEADLGGAIGTSGFSFLHKKSLGNVEALTWALRSAAAGLVVLDPRVAAALAGGPKPAAPGEDRASAVLALLAEGLSNAAIAERLCLAEKTVENKLGAIYRDLGIDTSDARRHPRVCAALAYVRGAAPPGEASAR